MTPKIKAKILVDKYLIYFPEFRNDLEYDYNIDKAKQCVLISVDELIIEENNYNNGSFYPSEFWQEVKQEILKL
jgi:ribosomal protein S30